MHASPSDISATLAATPSAPELVDTEHAAAILDLKPQTLALWRSRGTYELPFFRVGRAIRYNVADILAWLAARRG